MADYRLRDIVQRECSLSAKLLQSKKLGDKQEESQYEKELQSLPQKYRSAEHDLYLAEISIPDVLRKEYDKTRKDRTWYLRKELDRDCAMRGGCCSRVCGCCQRRHKEIERLRGSCHCTPACGCCSNAHEFEYTEKQGADLIKRFEQKMLSSRPENITYMARAYFIRQ
jgi:hypothetical protein